MKIVRNVFSFHIFDNFMVIESKNAHDITNVSTDTGGNPFQDIPMKETQFSLFS